jgi:hypothetical protein
MQIDTHTLKRMFTSVMQGRPIGHVNGSVIQHETYYNGHETRYSLRCVEPALGNKLQWQVWMIGDRKPTADDIKLTCKNRSFDTSQLREHDGMWFFDPNAVIVSSPAEQLNNNVVRGAFGGVQLGGFYQQPMFNQPGPNFYGPSDYGTYPRQPQMPWFNPAQQPGMDQVGSASRSAMFVGNAIDRAKVMRTTLLTRFGAVETSRLTSAMLQEITNTDKWMLNEEDNEVYFTFYGDPQFDSARDRVIAMKLLCNVLESHGYIIHRKDVEVFNITVRLP